MPPKKRKRTTKKKVVNDNLGDIRVNFTKPEDVVPPEIAPVEVVIPDGVTELSNGCLVRIVGRTDGAKIQYQKGWKKDTGLIEWTPVASMPKEMFYKYLKNMEVKK